MINRTALLLDFADFIIRKLGWELHLKSSMCRLILEVTSCGLLAVPVMIARRIVDWEYDFYSLSCYLLIH